ncbi:MAG: PPC domain-containing DNA-binding protein [Bulleidia sp.]
MEYIRTGNTYAVRMDRGEEVMACLKKLAENEHITFGMIQGLGASDHVRLGCYDVASKQYHVNTIETALEITNLTGNITTKDDEVYLHVHITVADDSQRAFGGHLNECIISGTCELFVTVLEGKAGRMNDDIGHTGLNIMQFEGGTK